ncbi:uncharacterized protein [Drosophila tropicalis]|uniref:uncharacterized protein n=1 Tax=Drosophila tropicalis TaxID=46794 RepID=UPI0035AC2858
MAVAPSKLLEWPLNRLHCSRVLHSRPYQSCTQALLWNIFRNHVSSAKYYSPLLLFPLLTKRHQLNRNVLRDIIRNYAQSASFAACLNAFTFYFMCIARRLNGRFVCSWTPFLSCWLSSQICWWMPPPVLLYFVTGITHAALESMLRQLNVGLVHSRLGQTFIFMICSLVVLHFQQMRKYSGFWFIKPSALPKDYGDWSLGKRLKHSVNQLRTYLGIGFALDMINALTQKDLKQLRKLRTTGFLGTYIGIFKLVQCLLIGKVFDLSATNLVAGFISGGAYIFLNRLTFMSFAIVIAIQVIWQQFCAGTSGKSQLLVLLKSMPWAKLLIPCNLAYLVHVFFYHEKCLNTLAKNFIDCTCDHNGKRLLDLMRSPNVSTIMSTVNKFPIMPFL